MNDSSIKLQMMNSVSSPGHLYMDMIDDIKFHFISYQGDKGSLKA